MYIYIYRCTNNVEDEKYMQKQNISEQYNSLHELKYDDYNARLSSSCKIRRMSSCVVRSDALS